MGPGEFFLNFEAKMHANSNKLTLIGVCQFVWMSSALAQTYYGTIANVTVVEGQNATMACTMDNIGAYQVIWTRFDKNNTIFAVRIGEHVIYSERHGVTVGFNRERSAWLLHISEVKPQDQGYYMCYVNTSPVIYQKGYLQVLPFSSGGMSKIRATHMLVLSFPVFAVLYWLL